MKLLTLLLISVAAYAEAEAPAAPKPEPVRQVTDSDLQNLSACARLQMKDLTPDQMAAVAQAIKHAEADIDAIRKANAVQVEVKK